MLVPVDITPGVSLKDLEEWSRSKGYPWVMARTSRETLQNLGVVSQSTKIAFNKGGQVVYREGMGAGNDDEWRELFVMLVNSSASDG